jgi:hypothetical protein
MTYLNVRDTQILSLIPCEHTHTSSHMNQHSLFTLNCTMALESSEQMRSFRVSHLCSYLRIYAKKESLHLFPHWFCCNYAISIHTWYNINRKYECFETYDKDKIDFRNENYIKCLGKNKTLEIFWTRHAPKCLLELTLQKTKLEVIG